MNFCYLKDLHKKIFQFLSTLNNEEVVQIIDTGISTICIEGQYIEEGEDGIEHQ